MSVLRVSCADKLHDARAIVADLRVVGDGLWDRFSAGKSGSLWYYRSLLEVFAAVVTEDLTIDSPLRRLVEELRRAVEQMERLAQG